MSYFGFLLLSVVGLDISCVDISRISFDAIFIEMFCHTCIHKYHPPKTMWNRILAPSLSFFSPYYNQYFRDIKQFVKWCITLSMHGWIPASKWSLLLIETRNKITNIPKFSLRTKYNNLNNMAHSLNIYILGFVYLYHCSSTIINHMHITMSMKSNMISLRIFWMFASWILQ